MTVRHGTVSVLVTVPGDPDRPWAGIVDGVSVSMVTASGVARAAARRAARRDGGAARSPRPRCCGPGAAEVRVVRVRRAADEHRADGQPVDRAPRGQHEATGGGPCGDCSAVTCGARCLLDWSVVSAAEPRPLTVVELQRAVGDELDRMAEVIDPLGELFAAAGHELALVGGPVRDAMLGRPHTDLDFATSADPEETERLLKGWGEATWDMGRDFGTIGCAHGAVGRRGDDVPLRGLRPHLAQAVGAASATT